MSKNYKIPLKKSHHKEDFSNNIANNLPQRSLNF
jgi:hypothetical protein